MCHLHQLDPKELKQLQQQDNRDGMRLEDYRRLFDQMLSGLEEVNIVGGGEPLVHPEIADIMRLIKAHGWRGSLITNGSLLSEPIVCSMIRGGLERDPGIAPCG